MNAVELQTLIVTVGTFVLIGAGANYSQYQDKVENSPEKWQLGKALPTLGLGGLGGLVAYFIGLPPEVVAISAVLGGVIPIYEQVRHGSLTFWEVASIARKGGKSPAVSTKEGAEAAARSVDTDEIRGGVEKIREAAEEHGDYYGDGEAIVEGIPEDFEEERREALGLSLRVDGESEGEDGDVAVVTDGP